jgi:hypothetical protein
VKVGVVLRQNSGDPVRLVALGAAVVGDQRLLTPSTPTCDALGQDCNPDFNQDAVPGSLACNPPPQADGDNSPSIVRSIINCNTGVPWPTAFLAPGETLLLASVTYAPMTGSGSLTLDSVSVYGGSESDEFPFGELMSCNPEISVPSNCVGAYVQIGAP